jgi:hypothetical protein
MSDRIAEHRDILVSARAYLDNILDQVGDRWDEQVYSDGLGWTVKQIVHHLADADRGHNFQLLGIAQGQSPIPEDFDLERYNASVTKKTVEKSVEQSRADLNENRASLNEWLDNLDEATLDVEGRHASLKIMSVSQILKLMAGHERMHAKDIADALGIDA